ncbi:hypothetical protein PHLCEN_2v12168 [Hermanssonia centrifuga]|uniref:U4/U6 snRNA-associated-splicing factor PRP24 n=1 Tax=Hermanssonia centrifuga TaxID=98765 RepID=A0A2R6NI73_9APHY|nr:hypothetical protein PHLCEN_2v12168 [Hermanssonia centrifuga]
MDEADAFEALADTLTLLTENPHDISLHAQHVRLARETGMKDQLEAALDMVTTFWAAGDYVWIPLIDIRIEDADLEDSEGINEVLALFQRAEEDYLSIPLLKKHIEFILHRHTHFQEQGSRPDAFGDLLNTEWTFTESRKVYERAVGHLSESHQLYSLLRDYITEALEEANAEDKPALVAHMENLLVSRLQQPHSDYAESLQDYSSFTTNYKPADQYESLLVQASKLRAQAVKAFQRRENYEASLAQAGFSLDAYAYYISLERRPKKPDMFVLTALYERAITEADKRRWGGEENAESALRTFWNGYLDLLRTNEVDDSAQLQTLTRATRSAPGYGDIWAQYIRFLERTSPVDQGEDADVSESEELIPAVYDSAIAIPVLNQNVEELVPVVLARAGWERRRAEKGKTEEAYTVIVQILMDGIEKVRKASPLGDPRLRLEKFFSALCTEVANMIEYALIMWEDTTKRFKASYLAWTAYADLFIKQGMYDDARKLFRDVANKNLDWPEALWEAWISFEHVHGSLEQLEDCLDRVERARKHVNMKRAKDAEKAAYQAAQMAAEQQATNVPVTDLPVPGSRTQAGSTMDVDMVDADTAGVRDGDGKTKRKADDEAHADGNKRARVEPKPVVLKRDRENSTVFVAELPHNTSEEDLTALFKDCGPLREVKIKQVENVSLATVEFMDRESVPAALTKDKKRVHGEEIAVHIAWKSTLYVTNFPESADNEFVKQLFGKYGVLFDIRWPSKKFKSSRRFCYVQYATPASAQSALTLHNTELAPGVPLSVYISNPARKKERTDSDANDRELYVAGVSKLVTKDELETLFETYGKIKEVRMGLDDKGQPKGFAFVEFEQEKDALAALAANNYELKKRRIAVTLADTNRKSKTRPNPLETRQRSVRIRNLPAGTQEGLLQQALEKLAKVTRVEVFEERREAIAELESLALSEESLQSTVPRPSGSNAPARGGALFVPRSTVSRPRAGLGSKKTRTVVNPIANSSTAATSAPTSVPPKQAKGQDDFRKMLSGS